MTPQQIRDAIAASPALVALAQAGNTQAIADALSVGRTRLTPTEVGVGTILEVLGLDLGNTLIDTINGAPQYRHIKPLLEQGRLRLDSALVQTTLQGLVPAMLTQSQADALANRARVPDPIAEFTVRCAIIADDGSLLV